MIIAVALLLLAVVVWLLMQPGTQSNRDQAKLFREFYRRKDAAERRGEEYPPHDSGRPDGRLF
jgi:hypothetical protein